MQRLAAYGEPVEGTPFGRYRLIELLGRMGEVWRAFDTVTERVVALKMLPARFSDDEMFQQRFLREARSAAGLNREGNKCETTNGFGHGRAPGVVIDRCCSCR